MGNSINNWISDETNVAAVQSAQTVLERVKRSRYGHNKHYQLVKVSDHPVTYREVRVEAHMKRAEPIICAAPELVVVDEEPLTEVDFSQLKIMDGVEE